MVIARRTSPYSAFKVSDEMTFTDTHFRERRPAIAASNNEKEAGAGTGVSETEAECHRLQSDPR